MTGRQEQGGGIQRGESVALEDHSRSNVVSQTPETVPD